MTNPKHSPATLNGRDEHGIWSDAAGGFIDTQLYTAQSAATSVEGFVAQGEDPEDLEVVAICPDHEEQRADTCEVCAAEVDAAENADEDED